MVHRFAGTLWAKWRMHRCFSQYDFDGAALSGRCDRVRLAEDFDYRGPQIVENLVFRTTFRGNSKLTAFRKEAVW